MMDREKIHNLKVKLAEEKPQFDAHLGGQQPLVYGVEYGEFSAARQVEIDALTAAIDNPQHTGLVFQNLPRHMRRRVMGHSSKRLPRMLREAHQNQLEKSGMLQKKKPNRKHKRRPASVLEAFNRRQREFVWLETHLWHAKRFHMVQKWGYKMAHFPNDKSFRACYRATAGNCMIQDISFLCCIELSGPLNVLLDGLAFHTRSECGLTFAAKPFLTGAREGNVTMFHRGRYPYGAVGNVSFLWKPPEGETNESSGTERRTLWIWVHPASHNELLDQFIWSFELKLKENIEEQDEKPPVKDVEQTKLATRNVPFMKTPKYENNNGVEVVVLKDTLNRFTLTGPLSQAVIHDALFIVRNKNKDVKTISATVPVDTPKPDISTADIDDIFAMASIRSKPVPAAPDSKEEDEEMDVDETRENNWWTEFYGSSPFHKSSLKTQREFWDSLKGRPTPAELPPNMVLGLTIVDPRLYMPSKRKKSVPSSQSMWDHHQQYPVLQPPPTVSVSPIWSSDVRDEATRTKRTVAEVNRSRERNLVPGFVEEDEREVCESDDHSRIPLLLIQRPGGQQSQDERIGYGCGWDLVIPAGWAMPIWMALVFRHAHPSGLREASGLRREMSDFEALEPDSMDGRREIDSRREELTEKHYRLPPAKRPNFLKLGISSPFACAWDTLTREWAQVPTTMAVRRNPRECCTVSMLGPYFVLRDRAQLVALRDVVEAKKGRPVASEIPAVPQGYRNCLVPVKLSMVQRGTPEDFSIVCVPTDEDLGGLAADPKYNGPVEPQHADPNKQKRDDLRKEHKALLKRLKKQRIRARRKQTSNGDDDVKGDETETGTKTSKSDEPTAKDAIARYRETYRDLWTPMYSPVKDRCSRLTIGYVSKGDYSLVKGYGAGVGYIPFPALHLLLTKQSDRGPKVPTYVLVRNPTSYQYYFAKLQINCPI